MERIGFLINKLKEQYEKASSQDSMLITLQMLYRELMPKMSGNGAIGKVTITLPGQMDLSFLEKNIGQKFALDLADNGAEKQVFELSVEPSESIQPIDKQSIVEPKIVEKQQAAETKPAEKPITATVEFPKNPFIVSTPKVDLPVQKPEPVVATEKPKEIVLPERKPEIAGDLNSRFMPPEVNQTIIPPVAPPPVLQQPLKTPPPPLVPPKEIHETIQTNPQPSLNDNIEKRQPELFNVLKTEPLKDLKRAISINDRFQYINHLFMKDETMYERSLKTINSFNVLSEAQFWIRKELATKMGWDDKDEIVQQFMNLVERRFA